MFRLWRSRGASPPAPSWWSARACWKQGQGLACGPPGPVQRRPGCSGCGVVGVLLPQNSLCGIARPAGTGARPSRGPPLSWWSAARLFRLWRSRGASPRALLARCEGLLEQGQAPCVSPHRLVERGQVVQAGRSRGASPPAPPSGSPRAFRYRGRAACASPHAPGTARPGCSGWWRSRGASPQAPGDIVRGLLEQRQGPMAPPYPGTASPGCSGFGRSRGAVSPPPGRSARVP